MSCMSREVLTVVLTMMRDSMSLTGITHTDLGYPTVRMGM